MRGALHSGFLVLIRRISSFRSRPIGGRPPRRRDLRPPLGAPGPAMQVHDEIRQAVGQAAANQQAGERAETPENGPPFHSRKSAEPAICLAQCRVAEPRP